MITTTERNILLAADWHKHLSQATVVVEHAKTNNVGTILHLGDFGIWEGDQHFLDGLQHQLAEADAVLYFVDGNHENFPRLYEYPIIDDGTRKVRNNIFHLPRGYRFALNNVKFLALGGAASIDRRGRKLGIGYWEEELITDDDVAKSIEGGYADVMLCHDSPLSAPNKVTDDVMGAISAQKRFGIEQLDRCYDHRKQLDRVVQEVRPAWLYHGHYHRYMFGTFGYGGTEHRTRVMGLDQGKASLGSHTQLYTADLRKELGLDNIHSSSVY